MISISAVLRSLHIGFENFGRVLTEYDNVITDILNIRQKNGQYSEKILNNGTSSKFCFDHVLVIEIMAQSCLSWAASGLYDKKRGKNAEVLPWHIRKTYLQFSDYPFLQ